MLRPILLVLISTLASCASHTVAITGRARQELPDDAPVAVLLEDEERPAKAERIGVFEATVANVDPFNYDPPMIRAIGYAKRNARKVGGNLVALTSVMPATKSEPFSGASKPATAYRFDVIYVPPAPN